MFVTPDETLALRRFLHITSNWPKCSTGVNSSLECDNKAWNSLGLCIRDYKGKGPHLVVLFCCKIHGRLFEVFRFFVCPSMVEVPQAPGPPAPPVQQIQQAPPQAANLEVDTFSFFQTGVSFITWTVMLLWSNVNFSEFSCSSGYFAFTSSLFMLPYFGLGRSPISYVICLALAALGVRWKSKCHLHFSFSDRERLLRGSCSSSVYFTVLYLNPPGFHSIYFRLGQLQVACVW